MECVQVGMKLSMCAHNEINAKKELEMNKADQNGTLCVYIFNGP